MDYLFLKDEIEVDASCVGPDLSILRRYSSESAPPSLYYIKGLKKYNLNKTFDISRATIIN